MHIKKKLLYAIGPQFCVKIFGEPLLQILNSSYEIFVVSDGPRIYSNLYTHYELDFDRKPSFIKDIKNLYKIFLILKKNNIDCVIYSTPKMSLLASIACWLANVKAIYIHRGCVYQNYNGIKLLVYKYIDYICIVLSKKTIFISVSLYQYINSLFPNLLLKYDRIYNSGQGVDIDIFRPSAKKNDTDMISIGYLGRINNDKGFDLLIELFKKHNKNNVRFIIKGKFEDDFYLHKIKEFNNISILEWDSNVTNFFHSIDLLVFPSLREGFGNVCIEAAACNIPVVGIKGLGTNDSIINGITGYLCDDSIDFINTVTRIINEKRVLDTFGNKPRDYVIENFDRNNIIRELQKIINEIF